MKALAERFETKPYGWPNAAILCTVASLFSHGKLEARSDGVPLEGDALERALKNSHALANIVLDLQVEFTAGQVRALRGFYRERFDKPPGASEGKVLGKEAGGAGTVLLNEFATPV